MNVTVKIFYSDNEYSPALYFCSLDCAWQLWFVITHKMFQSDHGSQVLRVEIWDGGTKIEMEKGYPYSQIMQQYRK